MTTNIGFARLTNRGLEDTLVAIVEAADGRVLERDKWKHRAFIALVIVGTESMTFTYRQGVGITEKPTIREALQSLVIDEDTFAPYEHDLPGFINEAYGGDDVRRGFQLFESLKQMHADLVRLFPTNLEHFLTTFRED